MLNNGQLRDGAFKLVQEPVITVPSLRSVYVMQKEFATVLPTHIDFVGKPTTLDFDSTHELHNINNHIIAIIIT